MELSRRVPVIAFDSSASDCEDSDGSGSDDFASLVDLRAAAQQQKGTKDKFHVLSAEAVAGWVASAVALLLYVGLFGCLGGLVLWPWRRELLDSDTESSGIELAVLWCLFGMLSVCWTVGLTSYSVAASTSNAVGPTELAALLQGKDEAAQNAVEGKNGSLLSFPNEPAPSRSTDQPNAPDMLRWCRKCQAPKPPRSHHCSVCGRCILKMDHHCPWINNCVGFHSHGHYVRFVGWTLAALLTALICLAWRLVSLRGRWAMPVGSALGLDVWELLGLVVCLVGSSVVFVLLGALAVGQGLQISAGHTTIEGLEWAQAQRDFPHQEVPFPFDLGVVHNWALVVGLQGNPLRLFLSLLPLPATWNPLAEGEAGCSERLGIAFRVRSDALMDGRWPLPAKDPLLSSNYTRPLSINP